MSLDTTPIDKDIVMALSGSGLRFHFSAQGLDEDSLDVVDFSFIEYLSTPFEVKLTLLSRLDNLTAESIVDQTGLLTWTLDESVQRQVHGIVSQFSKGDTGHHHTQYQLTLVPALARLKLRQNSRIFQQKTVLDIIATLLGEMGLKDYAFSCDPRFESEIREYCVQYRETDFEFISRLAAEVGLFYFFDHTADTHTLIFCDSTSKLVSLGAPFPYNAISGGVIDVPYVNAFSFQHQIKPASVTLKDNSFKKPQYSFLQTSTGKELDCQRLDYEHFDYPGRYKDDAAGIPITQVRQEYLRRDAQVATGKSNIMQAISGFKFDLMEHGDSALNRDWIITGVKHTGEQGAAAEEANTQKPTRYHNEFTAIPASLPWQARPNPKPLVTGPQMAIVVGPENEEIFCDEFGRVKVQFPWDRYGNGDASVNKGSSCWVRVSQAWAGGQYGMMAIPRIGHEVIVNFLEGDPDQPIITGRAFNVISQVPYPLPANKTRTGIKTQTHKGEGSNELRFEDECDKEEIYIHAQKDMNTLVENDQVTQIKHDQHLDVDNERFTRIKANDHLTVEGESRHNIKGDMSLTVEGSIQMKTGSAWINEAGTEVHIKAGQKVVIETGTEITLKAGGSFVKIDSAGVHLVGSAINLNSGGGAGSGSGFSGQNAILPLGVEAATLAESEKMELAEASLTSESAVPIILDKQLTALKTDDPVCEVCEENEDSNDGASA
ncbi:type VI secretion system tip protein VgrG [Shewanella benthica]|nr:type VI secretion system tip protein VgrG [Shewanella benthica]